MDLYYLTRKRRESWREEEEEEEEIRLNVIFFKSTKIGERMRKKGRSTEGARRTENNDSQEAGAREKGCVCVRVCVRGARHVEI